MLCIFAHSAVVLLIIVHMCEPGFQSGKQRQSAFVLAALLVLRCSEMAEDTTNIEGESTRTSKMMHLLKNSVDGARSLVHSRKARRRALRQVKKATRQALSSAQERAERMLEALEHGRSERVPWLATSSNGTNASPPASHVHIRKTQRLEHVPERCDLRRAEGRVQHGCWSALRGMQYEALTEQWLAETNVLQSDFSFQALLERADGELAQEASSSNDPPLEHIHRDVYRTFPGIIEFKNEEKRKQLLNLLKAYAVFDSELGYCQGMNFVAAFLLCYLDEDAAFSALILLMVGCNLRTCYLSSMHGAILKLWQLHQLVQELMPRLAQHMHDSAVEITLFATPWLMSLFASDFPLNFSGRVIDGVMAQQSMVPFFSACMALLQEAEDDLVALSGLEEQLSYLKYKPCNEWSMEKLQHVLDVADELELQITESKLKELEDRFLNGTDGGSDDTGASKAPSTDASSSSASYEQDVYAMQEAVSCAIGSQQQQEGNEVDEQEKDKQDAESTALGHDGPVETDLLHLHNDAPAMSQPNGCESKNLASG